MKVYTIVEHDVDGACLGHRYWYKSLEASKEAVRNSIAASINSLFIDGKEVHQEVNLEWVKYVTYYEAFNEELETTFVIYELEGA